jgi:hypothetical protein
MLQTKRIPLALLVPAALMVFVSARADDDHNEKLSTYKQVTTISIPDLVGFDISWVDSESARYYLADRGTGHTPATPRIDVIDTDKNKLLDPIPLTTAPNGVVAIHRTGSDDQEDQPGTLVVGGANSTAIFIDLAHPLAPPFTVNTGGKGRADELAYDPSDHLILIANDRDADLFVTLISTMNSPHIVGKILYDGSVPGNPKSTGGIEQPVWDGKTKRFYLAIPATSDHPKGEVDEIDPLGMSVPPDSGQGKITHRFQTSCGPAGLVLIPGQRLMTSCGDVLDIKKGQHHEDKAVVFTVPNVGGDEIWFNRGDERVYFGGYKGINVPVVNGLKPYNQIANLVVGLIATPPAPNHTTHSVAADSENNKVFVPVSHEGVQVWTAEEDNDNGNGEDDGNDNDNGDHHDD